MTPDERFALAFAVRDLLDQRGADADDWSMIAGFLATNAFASLPERERKAVMRNWWNHLQLALDIHVTMADAVADPSADVTRH